MVQDLRYAFRMLVQKPGFAAVSILSLALGIGANTALFSVADEFLLRTLPVKAPGELAVLAHNPEQPETAMSYPDYEFVRDHAQSFSGVIAYEMGAMPIGLRVPVEGTQTQAQKTEALLVSGNYFDVLGVTPKLGRLFTPDDNRTEGGHPYAILSHKLWQTVFDADPNILRRRITINGSAFSVIGVLRPEFTGLDVADTPDLYLPIMMMKQVDRRFPQWNQRGYTFFTVVARRKPGVTMASATAEMGVLFRQISAQEAKTTASSSPDKERELQERPTLLPGATGYSKARGMLQDLFVVLAVVVGLVLLIACGNIAGLLLARGAERQREIAVRLAVGASRWRLVKQLLTETTVLSLLGGLAGLFVSYWLARGLDAYLDDGPSDVQAIPHIRVLAFAFGASLITAAMCGLVPALKATRPDLNAALKNETRVSARSRLEPRRLLVIAQIAISMVLLTGAGLFIRTLYNLRHLDPGFTRENLLLVKADVQAQNGYTPQRMREFYDRLLHRAGTLPGVRRASLSAFTPLSGSSSSTVISPEGRAFAGKTEVNINYVSEGYFATLGIPMLLGRNLRDGDNRETTAGDSVTGFASLAPDSLKPQPVVIVNEALAKRLFPGQNPIGKRVSVGEKFDAKGAFEVAGVVKDIKSGGLRDPAGYMMYAANWRFNAGERTLCIRSRNNPALLENAIRKEIAGIDSDIAGVTVSTMQDQFDSAVIQERLAASLCACFSTLALLLAVIGLYGVTAHSVTVRYREIGIRMALGAERKRILSLVLREVALMVAIGAAIGIPAAYAVTRFAESMLFGLKPQDPLSMALAALVLSAATLAAGLIPARRATKVDPMVALRYE